MGLSHERIRQIEEIAWNKIKARASRLAMEGQKVPYPDLLEIVSKQKVKILSDSAGIFTRSAKNRQ